MADVSNSKDVLDVRDIIERFEELESERESVVPEVKPDPDQPGRFQFSGCDISYDTEAEAAAAAQKLLAEWDEDNADELNDLRTLLDDLEGGGGDHKWQGNWYPVTLIRDSYWEDYAREYAEDIHGDAIRAATWPMSCIDWEKAASDLQQDYSSVEYGGVTYWYR